MNDYRRILASAAVIFAYFIFIDRQTFEANKAFLAPGSVRAAALA